MHSGKYDNAVSPRSLNEICAARLVIQGGSQGQSMQSFAAQMQAPLQAGAQWLPQLGHQ
jgi:hypothetical protein